MTHRNQSRAPLWIVLSVVVVVLIGVGAFAGLSWSGRGKDGEVAAAPPPTNVIAEPSKTSLSGRNKEDLLKVLPTLQDMPTGWKELDQGSMAPGEIAPDTCAHVLPGGSLTPVASRYFADPADQLTSSIETYLFTWNVHPQLEKVKDYLSNCATYTRTIKGVDGAPDTVFTINLKQTETPKAPAESAIGYEEGGTVSPAVDGEDPTLKENRYLLATLRGVNLIVFCRNIQAIENKCGDVYVRSVTQLANIS